MELKAEKKRKSRKNPVYPVYLSAGDESDTRNGPGNQAIPALGLSGAPCGIGPKPVRKPVRICPNLSAPKARKSKMKKKERRKRDCFGARVCDPLRFI